jgi:hypothetical protein
MEEILTQFLLRQNSPIYLFVVVVYQWDVFNLSFRQGDCQRKVDGIENVTALQLLCKLGYLLKGGER